jgi:Protein of unknown function (DUF1549)/Protein of unknown function (DUF1553)
MKPQRFSLALVAALGFGAAEVRPAEEPWWSFLPVRKPAVPKVADMAWCRDGSDVFILAKLEAKGLKPNPDADRITLLRRASFDLTGLPPSPEEIEAFRRDPAPDDQAFARVVDRLLASPRFGERWARHWLDVVHYADSVGRTMNAAFPYAHRYRDYVIDALNKDKPYHRFVAEQVAGDLLPWRTVEERRENLTATGFLTMASLDLSEGGEQLVMDRVDDQIDVTTRAILGLTVACARCHDHKTDPVTQRDYYALAGIFYSSETWSGQGAKGDLGRNGYVDEDRLVRLPAAAVAATQGGTLRRVSTAADEPAMMSDNGRYPTMFAFRPDRVMGVLEGEAVDCAIRIKGDPHDRGEVPPRGSHAIPGLPRIPPIPKDTSGRLQLADWLASPSNPLTARVFVNRVWQHLLGRALVRTVDDFGSTGETPSDPALLDHLAVRFVEGGWSVKKLIRAMMLSRTYRLSSAREPGREKLDGANQLHWRAEVRRLELEPLRDTLLLVAGDLKLERPSGIHVAGFGGKGREARLRSLMPEDEPVRTIYLPVLRSMLPAMHELFDFPDPSQIKGQREVTTIASQSLFFMNNPLVEGAARSAATRLLADEPKGDSARVRLAFLRVLAREPRPDETADALAFLQSLNPDGDTRYRWTAFVQSLLASAEFRYLH